MRKIVSIVTQESESGTRIDVLGDGKIPEHITQTLISPPRIVVDICNNPGSVEPINMALKSPKIERLRAGYYQKMTRLVLDVKGTGIPSFEITSANNRLTISLSAQQGVNKQKTSSTQRMPFTGRDTHGLENQSQNKANNCQPTIESESKQIPAFEQLTIVETDDGQDDTVLFLKCLKGYEARNWSWTVTELTHLIQTYPECRFTERAYFLLARCYEELYSDSITSHFREIKGHYEDAINKFERSIYVPAALLAIGNLCFKVENFFEALAYYNLVEKRGKDSIAALKASLRKAKVLLLKKKGKEALSTLEHAVCRYPDSPDTKEARIEMAKILYEMNSFHRSLDILSELKKINPENVYRYPEISLYLGNNYYQLGDNAKARENLFRFYNSCPHKDMNHLLLTKIADTYRDEGLTNHAVKIYQLVLKRYPETEGALVSLMRLAEQQEEGKLNADQSIVPSVKFVGEHIGLSKEIYEKVKNYLLHRDKKNPLTHLALLKLAILYQKQHQYEKSFEILREVINRDGMRSLKKEVEYALTKTLGELLKEEVKEKRYINVLNIYEKEKGLFSLVESPDAFLIIGRAALHLNLENIAVEMFKRADSFLSDNEKAPDLLLLLGKDLFKCGKHKDALAKLNLLIKNYPSDCYVGRAYQLKGEILFEEEDYSKAVQMFSAALGYHPTPCERMRLLVDKATALIKDNLNDNAFQAAREAEKIKVECRANYHHIYQEIADLYFHLGKFQEALSILNSALTIEKDEETKVRLKLMIARCYDALDNKEDSLALYNQISSLNDPFWSNLARERIDEIAFGGQLKENSKQ